MVKVLVKSYKTIIYENHKAKKKKQYAESYFKENVSKGIESKRLFRKIETLQKLNVKSSHVLNEPKVLIDKWLKKEPDL